MSWNMGGGRECYMRRERQLVTFGLLWRCPEAARNTCIERGQEVKAESVSVGAGSNYIQQNWAPQEGEMRKPTNKLW